MAVKIQIRRDTSTNWATVNPILAQGEVGVELDTKKTKIGDGVKTWNQLGYWVGPITSTDVVNALGYTPYDSSNPAGYTDNLGTVTSVNNVEPVDGNVEIEIPDISGKVDKLTTSPTAGTYTKVTINSDGLVSSGTTLSASDIPSLTLSKISDVTATATEVNVLDGITASTTELNYTDGVTSNIQTQFNNITEKIPAQASDSNQLADKDFVNSSISTNTANFIGTFENESALEAYAGTVTNNDYAFVINSVVTDNGNDWADFASLDAYSKTHLTNFDYAWVINGSNFDLYRFDIVNQEWVNRATAITKDSVTLNTAYNRYKATVVSNVVTWEYEYTLNNSSFTAQQWASINSGITSSDVTQITTNKNAIGTLSSLSTTEKSNLVGAINEVNTTATGKVSDVQVDGSSVVSSGVATISNMVTTNTAQDITETKTFQAPQRIQSGNAAGALIVGADVANTTLTNNTRKLGRLGFPTNEDITLNCAFVSCDTQSATGSSIENSVDFGGRVGDTTSTSPDALTFTVAKEHNTTTNTKKMAVLRMTKDGADFSVQPSYNGANLVVDTNAEIKGSTWNGELSVRRTTSGGSYVTFKNTVSNTAKTLGAIGLGSNAIPTWIDATNTNTNVLVRGGAFATPAVGNATTPVYIDSDGIAQECTGVQQKVTVTTISSNDSITLADNTCFKGGSISAFTITVPSTDIYPFVCEIDFTSPSTATTITYSGTIKWAEGSDDITSDVFVPVASKEYTIMIWNNGTSYCGIAKGV